ncbi:hypothetical protein BLAT2472_50082 [Burkholderia latens]
MRLDQRRNSRVQQSGPVSSIGLLRRWIDGPGAAIRKFAAANRRPADQVVSTGRQVLSIPRRADGALVATHTARLSHAARRNSFA